MVSRKPHPAELRERAVQMVFELRAETGNARGSIARVGHRLGINSETLRNWVNNAGAAWPSARVARPNSPETLSPANRACAWSSIDAHRLRAERAVQA